MKSPSNDGISLVILFDGLLSLAFGVSFFFWPDVCLKQIFTSNLDGVVYHLARCLGAQQLGYAIFALSLGRSPRAESKSTHLMARLIGLTLTACITQHARKHYDELFVEYYNYKLSLIIFLASILLAVGTIMRMIQSGYALGPTLLNRDQPIANILVHADFYVSLVIGTMWIAFPDWLLSRQVTIPLTGLHTYTARTLGIWFVASHVYASHNVWWQHLADRRATAYGRALMCAGIFVAQIYSQYAYPVEWTGSHWVGISLFSTWTFSVLYYSTLLTSGKYK